MKSVFAALKKLGVPERNIQTAEFFGVARNIPMATTTTRAA